MKNYRILVLSGQNLNVLGKREVSVYGAKTFEEVYDEVRVLAVELGADVIFAQDNSEGAMIDIIQDAEGRFDGVIINAGAYTHYSYALRDAIGASTLPFIETHITNIFGREEFRRVSVIAPACVGLVAGFGSGSYSLSLRAMVEYLSIRDMNSS